MSGSRFAALRRSPLTTALRAGGPAAAALMLLSLANAAIAVAIPALLATTLTATLRSGAASTAVWWAVALLGAGIAVESLRKMADVSARYRAVRRLRLDLVDHLTRLGYRGQRRFNQGDLINRLLDSTDRTAQAAGSVSQALTGALTSLGALVALFVIDYQIGLAFLICVPAVGLLTKRHIGPLVALGVEAAVAQATVTTRLMDGLRGLRTIRSAGTVEQETRRILTTADQLRRIGLRTWDRQRVLVWQVAILGPLLVVVVLVAAGHSLTVGRVDAGDLLAISSYVMYALSALQILGSVKDFGDTIAAARRVRELLYEPALAPGTRDLPAGGGALSFRGVCAGLGDRDVLRDVTFDVPAGRTVALVGESGVGKTTLTAIAGGVLTADAGTVTFDGVPIGELRPDALRRAVVYAFERPALLGDTLSDALRYGDSSVSDAAVAAALRSTESDGFVDRLPERLDTPVDGLSLSGGELQRLGLARAACRSARLFVMDDALSSVDTSTEASISAALQHLARGSTRLLIAHRASTAARADVVVWLDGGGVAGTGTHRELLADPRYRAVFAVDATETAKDGAR